MIKMIDRRTESMVTKGIWRKSGMPNLKLAPCGYYSLENLG